VGETDERWARSAPQEDSSRRAGSAPAAAGPGVAEGDLDLLLARAATGLADATGARCVVALDRTGAGPGLRVVAAAGPGPVPAAPDPDLLAALAASPDPVDLGRPEASTPERHAAFAGLAAAVGLGRTGGAPWAVLAVAGPPDRPGAVRPRTLAALGAAARRLEGSTAAFAASARLAQLDADVQRLDRLASLGGLLAEIAHEVRNPLVSVKTFLQLLPQRLDDPDFLTDFHAVVAEELRRIERLLDVVLVHARPRPEEAEPRASAREVFDAVARLLAHRALEAGKRIEVDVPEGDVEVPLAADPLRQVVLNLALNAVDATPEGGAVHLRARAGPAGCELAVEDEGPGVSPAERERIFEPFRSTKPGRPGGLGLAISRRLVEQTGGRLEVGDRPGGGAVFAIRLPG